MRKGFSGVVKASGVILPAPGDEESLSSKNGRHCVICRSGFARGFACSGGPGFVSVSSQGLTDRNAPLQIKEAENNLAKARADFERSQKLFDERLLVEKEYLEAKTELDNAEARLNSLTGNYGEADNPSGPPNRAISNRCWFPTGSL